LDSAIEVDVAYYDENQAAALRKYPTVEAMERLVSGSVSIPRSEFLTYFLFHRKGRGIRGYESASEIRQRVHVASSWIQDILSLEGRSIRVRSEVGHPPSDIIEHAGEALGLSIVSRIHGLTEADWVPIGRIRKGPVRTVFDYENAFVEDGVVQVENKGRFVSNSSEREMPVVEAKAKIVEKKTRISEAQSQGTYPRFAARRYGTIAALDRRPDGRARVWLVDPESVGPDRDPRIDKVLARLGFLHQVIGLVSPRASLTTALANRISDLEAAADPTNLDGKPLVNAQGRPFDFLASGKAWGSSSFFASKSTVADGPTGGVLVQPFPNDLFFFGIMEDVLRLAAGQEFADILRYKREGGSAVKEINCLVSETQLRLLQIPRSIAQDFVKRGSYYEFRRRGLIHYSGGGIAFGFLPLA
jgi:hypothetical protein